MSSFRKASKSKSRLRMALCAPPGGGKTFSALRFAMALGKRVCVINTESGAIEKYLGLNPDGTPFDFDIAELHEFSPTTYTRLIQEAGREGYDVIVIDSLSHAWAGSGGALELKDKKGGNSFTAWKDITPMHNAMIEAILRSPCHIIATMRTKIGYVLEEEVNPQTGAKKSVPKKVGMEPVQRQGMEYEFDIVADLDQTTHTLTVTKSRCPLVDGAVVVKPGADFILPVKRWLEEGIEVSADHYAVKPQDLRATQEADREAAEHAKQAAAQEERRRYLQSMAQQPPAAEPPMNPESTSTAAPTPTEAAPFVADEPEEVRLRKEIAAIGAEIGRSPQDINEGCKGRFGCGIMQLPIDKLRGLRDAFQKARDQAQPAPAGNPQAA